MTRTELLVDRFAAFLGSEDFARFLAKGTTDRLRYWQERALSKFTEAHPELCTNSSELVEALRLCEVHREPLFTEYVPGIAAEIDHLQTSEMRAQFPRANTGPISLGTGAQERQVQVWYCAACRRAREVWLAGPGAEFYRLNYSGRWAPAGAGASVAKSTDVTRVLKKSFFPTLRDTGFTLFRGRAAYRASADTISIVAVRSVGRQFSTVTGFPSLSFLCQLGVHYRARGGAGPSNADDIPDRFSLDETLDLTYHDESRQIRERGMTKGEIERKDIWYVSRDGSNVAEAVQDLTDAYHEKGAAWLQQVTGAKSIL
jgi:hypothetical protein